MGPTGFGQSFDLTLPEPNPTPEEQAEGAPVGTFVMITSPVNAAIDYACLVTTTIQTRGAGQPTNNDVVARFTNAIATDNGFGVVRTDDGQPSQVLRTDADGSAPAPLTRASVIDAPGDNSVQFGVYISDVDPAWTGRSITVSTAYFCSPL